jgi:hypothetical protein
MLKPSKSKTQMLNKKLMLFFCFIFYVVENGARRELNNGVRLQKVLRIPRFRWFMLRCRDFWCSNWLFGVSLNLG